MKEIKLNNSNLVAFVDDDKFEELNSFQWRATQGWKDSYRAMTGHDTFMHHLVIGFPEQGFEVDHKDRNGLNNQKDNLRFVTKSQNQHNTKLRSDNTNGIKGVSWYKGMQKWRAYFIIDGKEKTFRFSRN